MARVGFFHDDDAPVLSEFPRELAVTDIHGINHFCASLQQAIGEAAGGRAEVYGDQLCGLDLKMLKRVLKFVAAATDESVRRGEDELIGIADRVAGFACGLIVDENLASHDGAFGLLPAFTDAAIHQCLIQTSHSGSVTINRGKFELISALSIRIRADLRNLRISSGLVRLTKATLTSVVTMQ